MQGVSRDRSGLVCVAGGATVETLPWLQATRTSNGSGPNRRGKYKSAYMITGFPDGQIRAIYGALTDARYSNPQALLQVDSYGGQVNAVAPDATAVAQRSSIMKLQYQTYWTSPEDDEVPTSTSRPAGRSCTTRTATPPCRRSRPAGIRSTCSTTPSRSPRRLSRRRLALPRERRVVFVI
jgi:hypothetical protein